VIARISRSGWLAASAAAVFVLFSTHRASAAGCVRPTDPGGIDNYDYGTSTVKSFGNASVLVWYATDGEHAVNTASTRSDGVPDDVANVAQVTSDALASYASMGFLPPISDSLNPSCGSNGGDARLDVYLVHMVGADGLTDTEAGRCTTAGAAVKCASFLFAQSNYAGFYPTADIGVHTVLPHETFHAVQNAYDSKIDRFWAEGTAQWAAKTLDPSLTDLERFLPAFFMQLSRSLDAPSNGVTSDFLYGSAIWPVFLTQRHGNGIVKSILEQEGKAGGAALDATDVVLQSEQSSLATEYATFAAWNAATGSRSGAGGYPDAAKYPEATLTELAVNTTADGSTSGLASYYYHVKTDSAVTVGVGGDDDTRTAATVVPYQNGVPNLDMLQTAPASLNGEGILVVSGITTSKVDAPYGTYFDDGSSASSGSSGGCAITSARSNFEPRDLVMLPFLGFLAVIRRRKSRAS
jgi:hypothetical protein